MQRKKVTLKLNNDNNTENEISKFNNNKEIK